MRWEQLFGDLEAIVEAEDRAAFDAEVADLARAERAALTLADRLRGQVGRPVTVRLTQGQHGDLGDRGDWGDPVVGLVDEVGPQWLILDAGRPLLVPLAVVASVAGLTRSAVPDNGGLLRRIPLSVVLRGLARDRATVRISLLGGAVVEGTIDRVGTDHLDVAEHPIDEPRRPAAVRGVLVLRIDALLLVRVL